MNFLSQITQFFQDCLDQIFPSKQSSAPILKGIHCRWWDCTPAAMKQLPLTKAQIVRSPLPYDIYSDIEATLPTFVKTIRDMGATPMFVTSMTTTQQQNSVEVAANTAVLSAFYAGLARQYPGCIWEIGNEPNIPSASITQPLTPIDYAIYANGITAAIKNADPTARCVSGGTSGFAVTYIEELAKADAFMGMDAIGVHPYGVMPLMYEEYIKELQYLKIPIWFTEYGVAGADTSSSVKNYFGYARGNVNLAVWFELEDNSDGTFGLINFTGTQKPSFNAYLKA